MNFPSDQDEIVGIQLTISPLKIQSVTQIIKIYIKQNYVKY